MHRVSGRLHGTSSAAARKTIEIAMSPPARPSSMARPWSPGDVLKEFLHGSSIIDPRENVAIPKPMSLKEPCFNEAPISLDLELSGHGASTKSWFEDRRLLNIHP